MSSLLAVAPHLCTLVAAGVALFAAASPLVLAGAHSDPSSRSLHQEADARTRDDGASVERSTTGVEVTWPASTATPALAALPLLAQDPSSPAATDPWPEDLPHDAAAWTEYWSAFADDLARESEWAAEWAAGGRTPTHADGERLARLCLAAFHQGRDADGWSHLTELATRDAPLASQLLPHVLVGGPLVGGPLVGRALESEARKSGSPGGADAVPSGTRTPSEPWNGALERGVVLRPALTPPALDDPNGRPSREPLEITGLTVGGSRVSMRLQVRGDGVDLRYRLDEGEPVEFAAVLPVPPGLSIAIEYFDWERAETSGEPLPVRLSEPGEWYRLWGRVRPDRAAWPTIAPDAVPRALELFGLELVIAADDPQAAYVAGFARACEDLFPFRVRRVEPGEPPFGASAQRVDLTPSPARGAKLRDLAGHLAHFVLARSRTPRETSSPDGR
ncbi:hypothetical protein Pla163_18290 [Planctomycetes bacterium Pla163]|uniref:Uncharacterized protein n=1 Tax=Rohdeia mirabilis TaxID=2528008 RepID=A0A518CZQ6_9BACT|nr:hypothetical protein Pla163_18290 [Planctomycetes bacterium Pla163]